MPRSLFLIAMLACQAWGQVSPLWPGVALDAAVPAPKKVLGYDFGERISSHANILRYVEALAAYAPTRLRVVEYGKTWEGRRLVYLVVGSEANLKRLDEIKASMQRLADPRKTSDAGAKKLMANLPAIVWLAYGVHGNEISSPDAALATAHHLLAARNDKMTQEILSNTLVLIDPLQNPDGRDRFVHNFEIAEGIEANESPLAAEHNEPWPGGRTNHYYFDMNRDWLGLTQPETRGRVRSVLEWYPQIFVDLHEMGSDSTYYFTPEADPFNPHLSKDLMEGLQWVGKNNAKWFDHFGFNYFTREVYDNFYPGYGASWPCYHGGMAMTYEQASARGLKMRKSDGTVFTFRDTVQRHFVAGLATLETAARYRQQLLERFYSFRKLAIEEGAAEPVKEYVLPRAGNVTAVDKLAALLAEHGIDVKRATAAVRVEGRELPAGSYVVPLAQPAKRLVRVLLDPQVPLDPKFVAEQERRRARKLPDEIYDVTGWSLPLLYNVEMLQAKAVTAGTFDAVKAGEVPRGQVAGGSATVAYLVSWGTSGAGKLLVAALREGFDAWSSDKAFTLKGRHYPAGTVIFRVKENPPALAAAMTRLAAESGAEVVATDTSWVEDGVNFGSRHVWHLRRPAVALAWDEPVSASSAGHTRFVLERQYGMPVTVIRTRQLATADLSRFQALILPDTGSGGGYGAALNPAAVQRLKNWVTAGGTLIGIGGGVSFLADPKVGLLAVAQEDRFRPGEPPKKADAAETRQPGKLFTKQEDFDKAIQADKELPDAVAGVLAKAKLDPEHWMSAGVGSHVYAMVDGRAIFTPIKLDKGFNPAVFTGPEEVMASGYMWEDNRKQLAFKPLVIVQNEGRGLVIGFTADPNFRAFSDGMNVLFLNAVVRGPARARPAP